MVHAVTYLVSMVKSSHCVYLVFIVRSSHYTASSSRGNNAFACSLVIPPSTHSILTFCGTTFTHSNRPEHGRQQLFSGTDSKDRFGKLLRRLLDGLSDDELRILGCPSEDIGAHSLRKGSSTYALGQVNGPNPVSVFLRMGRSLGK
jgi:hypothetical protein